MNFDPAIATATDVGVIVKDMVTLTGHPGAMQSTPSSAGAARQGRRRPRDRDDGCACAPATNARMPTSRWPRERARKERGVPAGRSARWSKSWISLVGEVEWAYQRRAAEVAVSERDVTTVRVPNREAVKPALNELRTTSTRRASTTHPPAPGR